jgi:hypothetical protein
MGASEGGQEEGGQLDECQGGCQLPYVDRTCAFLEPQHDRLGLTRVDEWLHANSVVQLFSVPVSALLRLDPTFHDPYLKLE